MKHGINHHLTIDIKNKRFGRWVVLSITKERNSSGEILWLAKCDCGIIKKVNGVDLRTGQSISCGCYRLEYFRKSKGHSGKVKLFHVYKETSEKRGIIFNVAFEDFDKLTSQNCFYCNSIPRQTKSNSYSSLEAKNHSTCYYNGLDRINNDKDYTLDNVVACCKNCNMAKGQMSVLEFYKWIKKIHKRISLIKCLLKV